MGKKFEVQTQKCKYRFVRFTSKLQGPADNGRLGLIRALAVTPDGISLQSPESRPIDCSVSFQDNHKLKCTGADPMSISFRFAV
jgi:hypothetical protein